MKYFDFSTSVFQIICDGKTFNRSKKYSVDAENDNSKFRACPKKWRRDVHVQEYRRDNFRIAGYVGSEQNRLHLNLQNKDFP